jgi:MFS family permease
MAVGAGVIAAFQVGKAPAAIPLLRDALGMSLVTAGWLISLLNAVAVVGGMAAGMTADRLGHRRVTLAGLGLIALANLLGGAAPVAWMVLASRFVEGIGYIAIIVSVPSLIVRLAAPRDLKLAFGIWGCYMSVGAATMILVSPLILAPLGWRGLWWVNAALAALYGLALAAVTRSLAHPAGDRHRGPLHPWRNMRRTIASPGPAALALCFMAYAGNWLAVLGFLPTFLIEQRGLAPAQATALTALAVVVNAAGNLAGGRLLQHGVARWRLLGFSHLSMAFTSFAIYSTAVPDGGRYLACLLFSGLSGVLPASVFDGVPRHAPSPNLIGTANGLLMQGANLGQMIGPPVLAGLIGVLGGWQASPVFVAGASTFGLICALWIRGLERGAAH